MHANARAAASQASSMFGNSKGGASRRSRRHIRRIGPCYRYLYRRSAMRIGDKSPSTIKAVKRQLIVDYLTDHATAKSSELAEYVDLKPSRVRDYLAELIAEGIVVAEGGNKNRTYRLKS